MRAVNWKGLSGYTQGEEMRKIIIGMMLVALNSLMLANPKNPGEGGGSGTPIVVGQSLGVLPGDASSEAWDVNAQGHAVGRSYSSDGRSMPMGIKAFYWSGTSMNPLASLHQNYDAEAWAISDEISGMETAVGYEYARSTDSAAYKQNPIVWQNPGDNPAPDKLVCNGDGEARGINNAGTKAAGACYVGNNAVGAIWSRDINGGKFGSPVIITVPEAFESEGVIFPNGERKTGLSYSGVATGVNDDGIVVGQLTTIDADKTMPFTRAYIYFPDGEFEVLPTPEGYAQTKAHAVSENDNKGRFSVAGSAGSGAQAAGSSQAILWAVDVNGSTEPYLLTGLAWGGGVSEDGPLVAGTQSTPDQGGTITQQTAMLYSNGTYIPLKTPSGGSDSVARSMSNTFFENGKNYVCVAGSGSSGTYTAAVWKVLIP